MMDAGTYTPWTPPVHHAANTTHLHTHTKRQFRLQINQMCMFLACGLEPPHPEKGHTGTGRPSKPDIKRARPELNLEPSPSRLTISMLDQGKRTLTSLPTFKSHLKSGHWWKYRFIFVIFMLIFYYIFWIRKPGETWKAPTNTIHHCYQIYCFHLHFNHITVQLFLCQSDGVTNV